MNCTAFLLSLFIVTQEAATGRSEPVRPSPQSAVAVPSASAPAPIDILNAGRRKAGAPPFVLDARLTRAAQTHCDDLASGRVNFATDPHAGFPARLLAAGIPPTMRIGEGVFGEGSGFDLAYWVAWLNAPKQVRAREPHSVDFRDAGFTSVGVGRATGPAGSYLCVDYGSGPAVPVAPPQPKPPVPTPSPVASAAASYRAGFPAELRNLADAVDAGKVATFDDLTASLAKARGAAAGPLNAALGTRWAPSFDAQRRMTNRADVARSIREAAAGWEGGGK